MANIALGGVVFTSSEGAKRYLREKIENYVIDKPVPNADVSLWFQVLQRHEWFDEYIAHGIKYFAAARSEQKGSARKMPHMGLRSWPTTWSKGDAQKGRS